MRFQNLFFSLHPSKMKNMSCRNSDVNDRVVAATVVEPRIYTGRAMMMMIFLIIIRSNYDSFVRNMKTRRENLPGKKLKVRH